MKKSALIFVVVIISCSSAIAQTWGAWSYSIPTNGLEGRHFRMQSSVKTILIDDSAAARLWARVTLASGRSGFFDNMNNRPIRSSAWKKYTIEGLIDSNATQLSVGAFGELNGKFFFDDLTVEVERAKDKWETIYKDDFEKDLNGLVPGIGMGENGISKKFTASNVADKGTPGKVLLIEGKDIIAYGNNKSAGKFAEVNGIKLYYEIYGEGQPLLVLHGNGGSVASGSDFYPELTKKYKVIAVDNRAQGKSTDTDAPLNYDIMAADIAKMLDQIGVDSCLIWGQSDGAILGLILAKDYPKKVKRVLAYGVNTVPDSSAIFGWAVNFVNKTINNGKNPKQVKLWTMMRDFPNIPYEDLRRITAPCLIMGGDRDVIRPEHLVKIYQNIPNSQLCILPGSTHGVAWENHDLFLTILNNFFTKPFRMPDTRSWFE